MINCSLTWTFENKDYFYEHVGLSQVLFEFNLNKIFLLINSNEVNEIVVLSMDSVILYHIFPKNGERFLYFEQTLDNLFATIESNQADNFGRNQFKYSINVVTYQLNKIGLSY